VTSMAVRDKADGAAARPSGRGAPPPGPTTESPSTPSLHRVWTGTVLKLLALMTAVGVVAVGAALYQSETMHDALEHQHATIAAEAELSSSLLEVNGPDPIGMMYGTGNTVPPAKLEAGYQAIRADIVAAFDDADRVMVDPRSRSILRQARHTWQQLDTAILAAPAGVASGATARDLAKGKDPNQAAVWARYNTISADFTRLEANNVDLLQQSAAAQDRTESLVVPAVLLTLLLGLALGWLAVRRMRRQVLGPILELRAAALAMREARFDRVIELDGGTVELQELAQTLNETAATLGATHRELRDQAHTDALTGLPNRAALIEHLHTRLNEPGAGRTAVLFIDVDDFKTVNDSLGHTAGDTLLSVVAHRLRSVIRDTDFVARLGGDEFAVIVGCGDRPDEALALAERTVATFSEPVRVGDTTMPVSCSIGVATSDAGAGPEAAGELLRNADFAMYMAKSQGKNRFEVFAASMHAEMLGRVTLKQDLGRAVQQEQLALHYQPVVDLDTGALRGFEALVRWQHPTKGLLPPNEFIALAEETGDIIAVGGWVLERACRDLALLRRAAPHASTLQMAINVSACQITAPSFVDVVIAALHRHAIPADAVTLEITEAVALTSTGTATAALGELRRHGVRIALDDFGVGYSSLRYLNELPVDVIKIDRSFVTAETEGADSMLEAIVTLGANLGLDIVAEGIETPTELARLRRFASIAGQGYLLARPMPLADAANLTRGHTIAATEPQVDMAAFRAS
jgi:diguanylate cyclase (GGDEF)-like protein